MELRQLRYFIGVAESGCISETSRQMFISQSAISQQIKLLEDELGTPLFARQHGTLSLTESGEEFLPLARQVLRDVTECKERIKSLQGLMCGEINVGLTYSLESFMRRAMLVFMRQHPNVKVNAYYRNLPDLLKMLNNREIDMMLSMMPTSPHDFVKSIPLTQYRLAAIMRKTHSLAQKKLLTFHDLLPHKLILPEKGLRDRNAIESFVHKETGNLNVRALVSDVNALQNIIEETNYIGILEESSVANRPQLCSVPIMELIDPIQIYVHLNNAAPKKNSVKVFVDILSKEAERRSFARTNTSCSNE